MTLACFSAAGAQLPRRAARHIAAGGQAELPGLRSNDIGFLVNAPGALWVSSGQVLSRMTGNGATQFDWTTIEVGTDSTRQNEGITAFAVDGRRIAVATAHSQQTSSGNFGVGDALYLSSDGGANWRRYAITDLFLDRANMTIPGGDTQCFGLAFHGPDLWATFTTEFAVATHDFGATWLRYRPDSTNNPQPNPFLQDPDRVYRYSHLNYRAFDVVERGDTLWVGTNAGINRSADGGVTWTNYDAATYGISGDFVPTLVADTASGLIWAATQSTGISEAEVRARTTLNNEFFRDGVINSLDWDLDRDGHDDGKGKNGVSWTKDGGATWRTYIPADDPALSRDFRAWNFAMNGGTVWVAGSSGGADGLLRSDDLGQSWRFVPIVTVGGDTVATDGGTTDVAYRDGTLWASDSRGLLRSADDGATWEFVLRFPQANRLGAGGVVNASGAKSGLTTYAFPSPSAPRLGTPPVIVFALAQSADLTIEIYDAGGALVRRIRGFGIQPGNRTVEWNGKTDDGRDVANGVYLYRITTSDGLSAAGKIMVLN